MKAAGVRALRGKQRTVLPRWSMSLDTECVPYQVLFVHCPHPERYPCTFWLLKPPSSPRTFKIPRETQYLENSKYCRNVSQYGITSTSFSLELKLFVSVTPTPCPNIFPVISQNGSSACQPIIFGRCPHAFVPVAPLPGCPFPG